MAARHATPRARRKTSRRTKAVSGFAVAAVVGTALWAWPALGEDHARSSSKDRPTTAASPTSQAHAAAPARPHLSSSRSEDDKATGEIPGLTTADRAKIPAVSRQVLVVTGDGVNSTTSTVVLYSRAKGSSRWQAGTAWPAHNAAHGWTTDHHYGDLRSPEGVFTLTDAGGKLAAPAGTKLPYDRNDAFVAHGHGVEGEPLGDAFNYVIAINYNRVAGSSPLDPRRPQGAAKGGGVWLHVDHNGPTQGCVSLKKPAMRELLRTLDPRLHPVVVMRPRGH
ncbi:L,D-transpeptidase family protein [Streptomyces sp. NPDC059740]|uniref:L,D-transpeptidase family protein n=1 Tax=Streptomyces sp. NPDC059740 TaxID=3346926 RepID=UPI003648C541